MKIAVLYLHHCADEVTQYHYRLLQEHNRSDTGVKIIPVCFPEYSDQCLEGSYLPRNLDCLRWNPSESFHRFRHRNKPVIADLDCLVWDWVLFSGERVDRIVLAESDMLSLCGIREFFTPSFKHAISGSVVRLGLQEHQDWPWFHRSSEIAQRLFGNLVASITPVCGIQISWRLAVRMATLVARSTGLFDNIHVEMAFGTLARLAGADPVCTAVPDGHTACQYIDWQPGSLKLGEWGLYHPVKIVRGRDADGSGACGGSFFSRPWMSTTEIAAIERRLRPDMTMLEYGAGGSTLHFSRLVNRYFSVEHDFKWFEKMRPLVEAAGGRIILESPLWEAEQPLAPALPGQFSTYVEAWRKFATVFDAVLIDGRARVDAALSVAEVLRPGAFLFFHDFFARERYWKRLPELEACYELVESVMDTPQTLAVFRRTGSTDIRKGNRVSRPGSEAKTPTSAG